MIPDFDQLPDRRSSESFKWHAFAPDVLPMWVADMDFPSPEPVIRALRQRAEHGVFGYPATLDPENPLTRHMRQVIADRMLQRYNWQVPVEDILLISGVVTAFNLACHALAAPGGGVLVQTPVYPPMLVAPGLAGMARHGMQLNQAADGSYFIDWDAFDAALTPETRMFLLCSPHNPVGRVFRRDELERMAQACLRRGVVICSDEIHSDLVYPGHPHLPIASLDPEIARSTITLLAPSKTFNIAGMEFSAAIISNPDLRKQYLAAQRGLTSWISIFAYTAARAAYEEGQEWLDALLLYLQANRDFLFDYVQQGNLPGVRMACPEGTYLAWLDCRQALPFESPGKYFLQHARVAFNDGATFGPGGDGFIRLNFGCPRPMLVDALQRMRQALLTVPPQPADPCP